jgi:hypothetical protein
MPDGSVPGVGEEVLAIGEPGGPLYAIGRLAPARVQAGVQAGVQIGAPATAPGPTGGAVPGDRVQLPGGARAELESDGERAVLRLYAPGGGLLLEYDSAQGRVRLAPECGDLELAAPAGDLALSASGTVLIEGGRVALRSLGATQAQPRAPGAGLVLDGPNARLCAARFDLEAGRAELRIEETELKGRGLRAELGTLDLLALRVETAARTMAVKTQDLYRRVSGVLETRAGRVRSLVEGTYHLKAGAAVVRAERDIDMDAEKIRLG